MSDGLDISGTQESVLDYLQNQAPAGYDVIEGDIMDAYTLPEVNGVRQTTLIVQFGDLLASSNDYSFGGPTLDGYYFLMRVYCVASTAAKARKARSVVNQILLGAKPDPNISTIHKDYGGGSYSLGEANSRPIAYVAITAYRAMTNISGVGATVYPPTPTP